MYCGYYLYAQDEGIGEYQCEEVLARGQELALLAGEAEEAEGNVHEESAAAELDAREEGKAAEERRVLPKGGYANQDQRFNLKLSFDNRFSVCCGLLTKTSVFECKSCWATL